MSNKTINEFVKEMREVFGDEQLEICVWDSDNKVIRKTKGWVDEDLFIKQEKLLKSKLTGNGIDRNSYGYSKK